MSTRSMASVAGQASASADQRNAQNPPNRSLVTVDSSTQFPGQSTAGFLVPRQRQMVELCHPWVSRSWPSTAKEEAAFVVELETLCHLGPSAGAAVRQVPDQQPGHLSFNRRDVTALVTALRCGLTVTELTERARGLRPGRLLAAHRSLDGARLEAAGAWRAIVEVPTAASLMRYGPLAASMLPAIISHLDAIARRTPRELEWSVGTADAEISRTTAGVEALEEQLEECVPPSDRGRAIGTLLYDVYGEGAWNLGTYMSSRVGTLVPLRVAALLGEELPGQLRRAS